MIDHQILNLGTVIQVHNHSDATHFHELSKRIGRFLDSTCRKWRRLNGHGFRGNSGDVRLGLGLGREMLDE